MSFPRYEKYKDSGVEWLGEVPMHWVTIPIKHLGRLKGGAGFPHIEQGVVGEELSFHKVNALAQAGSNGVLLPSENTITRDTAAQLGAFIFPPLSIVFAKVGAALLLGRIRLLGESACIDNNMMGLVVRQPEHDVGFVRYAMSLIRFDLIANPGAVPSLNEAQIGNFPLAIPCGEEQRTIAVFLDRETTKIDALIAEQQRLIELLKEKPQAVISHAVTKGLTNLPGANLNAATSGGPEGERKESASSPDAPMKDSGIEWLGQVPAHWDVNRLKFIADVQSGIAKGKDNSGHYTIDVPYLRVANVQDGFLDLDTVTTIEIPASDLDRYRLRVGDVLMNEGGDYDKLGRGHIWHGEIEPCIHQNHVFAVRPKAVSSEWLNEITNSDYARFYFMTRSKQSTNLASISSTNIMELPVVLPPPAEQQYILAAMSEQRTKFDSLTAEAQRAIELLKERRTALISAAVTGKIDVRGFGEPPKLQCR